MSKAAIVKPRNFVLLEELEDAEKKASGGGTFSLGLGNPDDITLTDWSASVFTRSGDILTLAMVAGPRYPDERPRVFFTSELPPRAADMCGSRTTHNGDSAWEINAARLPYLASWARGHDLKGLLADVAARMG
mmetsp:Transcript_92241/g.256734  ORF Transcript_92241/g.256734 Transcript_92241/m.256734 type:complete len:133 (+) Transcript_92241:224-622(+)